MSRQRPSESSISGVGQGSVNSDTCQSWMTFFAANIHEAEAELTELDRAIGDADHGINMRRGVDAVVERLKSLALPGLSGYLRTISITLTSSVGGASGPLYGAFFLQCSQATQNKEELNVGELAAMVEAGYRGVVQLGKANEGDKTMVDTLAAAIRSLQRSRLARASMAQTLEACRQDTAKAAKATVPMIARKGRASYLGERSAGFQDPGATSTALLFDALARAIRPASPSSSLRSSSKPQPRAVLL